MAELYTVRIAVRRRRVDPREWLRSDAWEGALAQFSERYRREHEPAQENADG